MADATNIQNLLAALAAQRPASTSQTPPGVSNPPYPPPAQPASAQPAAPYQAAPPTGPAGYGSAPGLPAPAASGSLDLSAIQPVNSGTMSFTDALSKVRASAAEKGVTPYDRPLVYGNDPRAAQDRPSYPRSRSRSPPRGDHNDNPYRDERRGGRDRGDYGRSRDRSYSPGPARGGRPFSPRNNGRDRSPLRGGDDHSEVIQIESSLVGLIIGRQGENLRRIESESTCRVQFLPPSDGGPFRQCKISGPRHRRTEVKAAIDAIIDDSGMGPLNRAHDKPRDPSKGGTGALRDGEDHTQIMVPDRTVGLIIGRGGETIRDLQERSGCHINIVGESKSVNGLRPVNLIGTHESASKAKDFIMEIVESDSRGEGPAPPGRGPPPGPAGGRGGDFGGPPRGGRDGGFPNGGGGPDKTNDVMYVPSDAVGMIIGKGGETIREMQTATGCKINVASSSGPGEVEREIALIGSRDSIENAKLAIEDKVEAVKNSGPGGRGPRHHHDYDRPAPSNYNNHQSASATNHAGPGQQPQGDAGAAGGAGNDPYAQYGGYQNYVALWYQSLMYQQQQGGGGGDAAGPPASAPGS